MSKQSLVALLLLAAAPYVLASKNGEVLPLWPGGAPGSESLKDKMEVITEPAKTGDSLKVSAIHNPSLILYLPPKEKATGAAMIVAPGGGHRFLSIDTEGTNVAEWLNSIGVAAFVLKYRLAKEPDSPYKVDEHPFADVQRAIRIVRARSAEWNINPAKIGVMGFSAGGEVAVMAPLATMPAMRTRPIRSRNKAQGRTTRSSFTRALRSKTSTSPRTRLRPSCYARTMTRALPQRFPICTSL